MAKSALERKREQLERDREALRVMPDSSYAFLDTPFFAWLKENGGGNWHIFEQEIQAAGFAVPDFEDDSGPRSLDGTYEESKYDEDGYDPYAGYEGSVGRAESIVDHLLTSAQTLALVIREYKLEQIEQRIAEIEAADLSDPESKKKALADMVTLTKIREQLHKQTRFPLYSWKVKGV